jgi:hypothetical protein
LKIPKAGNQKERRGEQRAMIGQQVALISQNVLRDFLVLEASVFKALPKTLEGRLDVAQGVLVVAATLVALRSILERLRAA